MKLKRHRADLRWLSTHLPHREVDAKGCVLCGVIKRHRNLIRMAEETFNYIASLQWAGNPIEYRKWEKRVMKGAEVKK